jgi:hypothetical protein
MADTPRDRQFRSLEEAVADLTEKLNSSPAASSERARLQRMIDILEAEIALRAERKTPPGAG